MIVLSGPSASGKTEVAKILADKYGIEKIITTTTRTKREGEVDGMDYFFVTKKEFENKIKRGDFVEYMEYNGNYYGSTKDQIQPNKCIVTDLNGLKSYCKFKLDGTVTFFLCTNEKMRYERMICRGDTTEKAQERIIEDKKAFANTHLKCIDFLITNENQTLEELAEDIYNKYCSKRK